MRLFPIKSLYYKLLVTAKRNTLNLLISYNLKTWLKQLIKSHFVINKLSKHAETKITLLERRESRSFSCSSKLFLDAVTDSVTGEDCDGNEALEDSLDILSKLPEVPEREFTL